MKVLRVVACDEKTVELTGIPPVLRHCLFQLPEILRHRTQPGVRERLFPDPEPGNARANADWHELADPELRHLFVSAEETVVRDLAGLEDDRVRFPAAHLSAWMSAINQARLILGELHHVTEQDMDRTDLDPSRPKDVALLEIHVLGYLLQTLVDFVQNSTG